MLGWRETGGRGLEWAVIGDRGHNSDDKMKVKAEQCYGDDDPRDCAVDCLRVLRKGTPKQHQRNLEHDGKVFQNDVKMPSLHPVQLLLAIPALLRRRPSAVPDAMVDPFLPEYHREGCEEWSPRLA